MKQLILTTTTSSTTSTSTSSTDLRETGQQLIKLISNLCFSFFVISVLILSVIAITYQPPNPWFQSSISLTNSLSSTHPNSTFSPDNSLILTGEDLPSSSPSPPDSLLVVNSSSSSFVCDQTDRINCSNPAILTAIQRFNSKIFRKSILFISYDAPVDGSGPDECDAGWRFRNRLEKSWRRYRDYRRFRFAPAENCSFEVVFAGKFRSGVNAGVRRPRIPVSPPAIVPDPDINDTIPTVGSESEFRRGRYLYYARGGDHCKSMNHYLWSFLCGIGEANFLNRTFVMDLNICLEKSYTSSGEDEDGKDFRLYFDFEHLKESASVVEEVDFLRDWKKWDRSVGKTGQKKKIGRIGVRKVPSYKITPMQLKKEKSAIVWRQFDGPEPENYWYRVCEGRAAKYIERPWHAVWKSKRLMNIVSEIAGKMDWDYDALHVVRGEKAKNKEMWPNLDGDTSPESLVEKVTKLVRSWRNLYIGTNEPFYNYFDKLRSHYKVHLLDDYREFWGNKSEWYNETRILNGGRPVEFDGYMRVAVDTEILYRAKARVETFNNLTRDCKDGINTC